MRNYLIIPPATFVFCILLAVGRDTVSLAEVSRQDSAHTVAGWIENAWLDGDEFSIRAKLDTGAKTSSINAFEHEEIQKNGKDWVRFSIKNSRNKTMTIVRPIEGYVRIRRAGVKVRERPVISLKICVAGHTTVTEFTLADRSDLNYQVLLGRKFLANRILVDSGKSFLNSGVCKKSKKER